MIKTGVLLFSPRSAPLRTRVAGLSLFERGIRTVARTGVERLVVVTHEDSAPPLSRLSQGLSTEIEIVTGARTLPSLDSRENYLVVLGDYVHHHESLTGFLSQPHHDGNLVAQVSPVPQDEIPLYPVTAGHSDVSTGAFIIGADTVSLGDLVSATAASDENLHSFLLSRLESGAITTRRDDRLLWRRVLHRRSARSAKRMLFNQVTKKTSGPVSRHINARISIPTSKLLIETGISPHMVTILLVLTTGLSASYLVAHADHYPSLALAGLLWQFAAIFDRCDGEIARVKLCESKFGEWFDTLTDNIAYFCAYAGIVIGVQKLYPDTPAILYMGVSTLLAMILTLGIMYAYAFKTGSGSLQNYLVGYTDVPEAEKGFMYRILERYGYMAKRDFWSFVMFILTLLNLLQVGYAFVVVGIHLIAVAVLISQHKMLKLHRSDSSGPAPAALPALEALPTYKEER